MAERPAAEDSKVDGTASLETRFLLSLFAELSGRKRPPARSGSCPQATPSPAVASPAPEA